MKRWVVMVVAVLALVGCDTTYPPDPVPPNAIDIHYFPIEHKCQARSIGGGSWEEVPCPWAGH